MSVEFKPKKPTPGQRTFTEYSGQKSFIAGTNGNTIGEALVFTDSLPPNTPVEQFKPSQMQAYSRRYVIEVDILVEEAKITLNGHQFPGARHTLYNVAFMEGLDVVLKHNSQLIEGTLRPVEKSKPRQPKLL